mmetsp:Transcript_17043/g.47390  ORF Transcript_17043/g.47390 Transcript_17043/m.47390 type:complete len:85 (-) Transcript_17043:818-1072(-)
MSRAQELHRAHGARREDGLFAYVRLDTRDGSLAISKEHWLFANGKESSPARIARGDYIHSPAGEVAVESVRKTVREGSESRQSS